MYASGVPFTTVRRPIRFPNTRPALPRASSDTSGFFFCGMIDDPVVWESGRVMKPNSNVEYRISSSLRRERCADRIAQAARNSSAKSRLPTPSRLFAVGRAKPSADAVACRSTGQGVPASAEEPSGDSSMRSAASRKRPSSRSSIATYAMNQ